VLPPDSRFPIIGPELATYGAAQPMARQLGLATLGTLNQRIGDTLTLAPAGAGWGRSTWGRLFAQQVNDHYQAFADPRSSGWLGGIQVGFDLWRGSLFADHGDDAGGVYIAYGHASADITGLVTNPAATGYVLTHTGDVALDAYSAGAYWTHYGQGGWYLDAVFQATAYQGHATTPFARLPTRGFGIVGSLEAGYPIPLPLGPHFVLEPQAQIIWQQVTFDDADDGLGPVSLGTTSGPIGRLGLRGRWTLQAGDDVQWQPYAAVNAWHAWGAQATTMFGIDSVLLRQTSTRVDFIGGASAKLSNRFSLYAQAGYQLVIDPANDGTHGGAQGSIGVRYNW
jgi:outer membrane autotransporter protein